MSPRLERWPAGSRRRAFTLIELLVAVAILTILATVVAPSIFRNVGDARRSAARSQIELFGLAIESYRMDMMRYPSTEEGLQALRHSPSNVNSGTWRGPYVAKDIPSDPWDRPYVYRAPGTHNRDSYDLYSLGRDGQVGGEGEDQDITSWGGPVRQ